MSGYINFGNGGGNNALAAFGQGMQLGNFIMERREAKERKNALAAYATDPSEENFAGLAQAVPEYAIRERERMDARNAQQQETELTQRALAGDADALRQLAVTNFDRYRQLNADQKAALAQEAEIYGNAAMDVLNLPPEQRAQAVMNYATHLQSEEIAALANLPPQELEAALRAQIAESGMMKELREMERPDYRAVPYDSTLVNVRDPEAVRQFAGGGMQPPSKSVGGATYYQNPETGEWYDNAEEAMGGTASNGGGGFQR